MSELTLSSDQQVLTAEGKTVPPTGDFFAQAKGVLAQPAIAKALPLLGLIAVTALAAAAWLALREPPQRDLFRGLPESDKAAVAEALTGSGITYMFDNDSGALTVGQDDYHTAKMVLAAEGLPRSAPDGDTLISSMPMGASRAVEGEKLRTAREMDLARTIEAMDSVITARVHLAVEAPSIFIRDRSEPSASVMLTLAGGARLGDDQVQSIVHLVASSVPGLSSDSVSVVDQNGRLMSRNGTGSAYGEADEHLQIQERIEERYRRTLVALLTPMLGADNFTAEVTADMDFAEKQSTRESFPEEGARLRSEQGSWSSDAGERSGGYGIPGALSNTPPDAAGISETFPEEEQQDTAETEKSRTSEKFARQYEMGREVSVVKEASGNLRRLSVAVALRSPVGKNQKSKEELAAVEALVKGAIGFSQERGDVVAVEARKFQDIEEIPENWWEAEWVSLLVRNLSALLVALALIFGIGRPLLKKMRSEKKATPAKDLKIASEIGDEINRNTMRRAEPVSLDMISSAAGYAERASLIQNFVRQNPDHAALVVQDLMGNAQSTAEATDA